MVIAKQPFLVPEVKVDSEKVQKTFELVFFL